MLSAFASLAVLVRSVINRVVRVSHESSLEGRRSCLKQEQCCQNALHPDQECNLLP